MKNFGVCPVLGKKFVELMSHLVYSLDKECICADHNRNVKIIGSVGKKHEKMLQDIRVSIINI